MLKYPDPSTELAGNVGGVGIGLASNTGGGINFTWASAKQRAGWGPKGHSAPSTKRLPKIDMPRNTLQVLAF